MLALINRRAYADLVQGSTIDIALSPAQAVIGELLAHVRRGDVEAVHSLRRGAAEALEAWRAATARPRKVVGRRIDELGLPRGCAVGAIVRGDRRRREPRGAASPHHDTVIEPTTT